MFGLKPWTIDSIKRDAQAELINWPDELQKEAYFSILKVFEFWKQEHGDRAPKTGGLLCVPIDFEEAKPYQTAGIGILDNISFAMKLSSEKYKHFEELKSTMPLPKVLALLLLNEVDEMTTDSVLIAKDYLARDKRIGLLNEQQKILEDHQKLLPLAHTGANFRKSQKEKAQKTRGNIESEGTRIQLKELIRQLATSEENRELSAKELWSPFFSVLEKYQLDPITISDKDLMKESYSYLISSCEKRKKLTYGRFLNIVSECRNAKKSR